MAETNESGSTKSPMASIEPMKLPILASANEEKVEPLVVPPEDKSSADPEHDRVPLNVYDKTLLTFIAVAIVWMFVLYYLSKDNLEWYESLEHVPSWAKNNKVVIMIGCVSIFLLAIGLFQAYASQNNRNMRIALCSSFGAVIILSSLWYYVFFKKQNPKDALNVSLVLLLAVLAMGYFMWISNPRVMMMMIPFVVWALLEVYIGYAVGSNNTEVTETVVDSTVDVSTL